MLWLYIHLPHLLLEQLARGNASDAALVIPESRQGDIYQASQAARQRGIRPGMRLKTALNLVPDLAIIQMDPARERHALEQQARWLYRQAAQISLYPPNGLLIEVSSLMRLHGGLPSLWQTLGRELKRRQLTSQMATGLTPRAAQCLAQANIGQCTGCPERLNCSIWALPIGQAGLSARTLERLSRLGLNTLGDVFALPASDIAHRLEPETLHRLQQIQGTRPDPQTAWSPPHHFHQRTEFVCDVEQSTGLLFPLHRTLGELEDDLRWRQQDTDSLKLTLHHRNHPETRLSIRTAGPEHRADAFLTLAKIRLEQLNLAAPVQAVTLTVHHFIKRGQPANTDLLGSTPNPDEAWQTLISRLQARLGEHAIKTMISQPDHRPERAWAPHQLKKPGKTVANTRTHKPRRPLWLLHTPQPVHHLPETWFAGPERISGGWWDGERVQRDYYIAQCHTGQLAWLFRDAGGGWFVHGWFG